MKGMRKVRRGSGFRGVANYTTSKGEIIGGNMSGKNAKELASEFKQARQARPDIKKPVWHNSLRLPVEETINKQQWIDIVEKYMEKMGFSQLHQRFYTLENDPEGQHIHIVASRVSIDGKVYLGKNENLQSTRIIQNLEKEFGLTITKGPEITNDKKTLSSNEIKMTQRTGQVPPKQKLQYIIDEAIKNNNNIVKFMRDLLSQNVNVNANVAKKSGKMNGFSFEIDGIAFKASNLGKSYSWKQLQNNISYSVEDLQKVLELNNMSPMQYKKEKMEKEKEKGKEKINFNNIDMGWFKKKEEEKKEEEKEVKLNVNMGWLKEKEKEEKVDYSKCSEAELYQMRDKIEFEFDSADENDLNTLYYQNLQSDFEKIEQELEQRLEPDDDDEFRPGM